MYVRLQANFPKWFEPVLLNPDCFPWISTIRGGGLCGRKNVLFSAQSNKKSVKLGTLPVFDFCHQTPCEKHPSSFSRMRSKGSRFTLGVWGLRVCSLHVAAFTSAVVRNRSQPFATVRVRAACKRGHFWRFQSSRGFVSRGRRGTS